jgi:ribosomal protein S14
MGLTERLKSKVLLRKSNTCESCGNDFSCEIALKGCWCSEVKVSDQTREHLRENFKLCLCRNCLASIEAQVSENK